jgi:hypothetical protein
VTAGCSTCLDAWLLLPASTGSSSGWCALWDWFTGQLLIQQTEHVCLPPLPPPAGISESYRSDPTATTTTLAEALKLANDEGYAQEAAQATIAALIEGGGWDLTSALAQTHGG